MADKRNTALSKKKFDKKTYDNVGLRYKRGIKNILNYVISDFQLDITISDMFRIALENYLKEITGEDILKTIESDIDMLLQVVKRPEAENIYTIPYVYENDFDKLLDLRQRAENNYSSEVISEEEFKTYFKKDKSLIHKLSFTLSNDDEWFWTSPEIYEILYKLVYQANINFKK